MSEKQIKLLMVDDDEADVFLTRRMLEKPTSEEFNFHLDHCGSIAEALAYLASEKPDALLLDLGLPGSQGLETLEQILTVASHLPIVVFTGLADEALGIRAVQKGSQDYLVKDQVNSHLLVRSLRYSIERHRLTAQVGKLNEQLNDILVNIGDGFFALNNDMTVTLFNKTAEKLLGRKSKDIVGRHLFGAFPEAKGSIFEEKYTLALDKKIHLAFEVYFEVEPYVNWYEVRVSPHRDGISVYFQVITERKKAEVERERLIEELQDALAQVKILKGFLPICSYCKRIRNDAGYWENVENYIRDHSEAEFSHGICPECLKEHYSEFHDDE
jgi:PAS domain S-box-containing protein